MSFDQPMQDLYWNTESLNNGIYEDPVNNNALYQDLKQENIEMLNQANEGTFFMDPHFQQSQFQQQLHQHQLQQQKLKQDNQNQGNSSSLDFLQQLPPYASSNNLDASISSHSSPTLVDNGQIKYSAISPESMDEKSQLLQLNAQPQQQQQLQSGTAKKSTLSKRHLLDEQDAILLARDDSELTEDELLAKKKAQNRAAQRAFRERKESKFKDLEARLNKSEAEKQKLLDQLTYFRTQNEQQQQQKQEQRKINTAAITPENNNDKLVHAQFAFPRSQVSFINELTKGHPVSDSQDIGKVYDAPDFPDTKLLAVGAVWDYLQIKAEEYERDDQHFDVVEIMTKLKGNERCHGYGPAYPLDIVDKIIEESIH